MRKTRLYLIKHKQYKVSLINLAGADGHVEGGPNGTVFVIEYFRAFPRRKDAVAYIKEMTKDYQDLFEVVTFEAV